MHFFKKISVLFIIITIISATVYPCCAETYFYENGFTYSVNNGYASIVGYGGTDEVVEIPLDFNGFVVNTIDMAAFSNNNSITEIKLPYLLRYINSSAFSNMKSLKKITIHEFCERLGTHSFSGCEALDNLSIITKNLKTIPERTFYNCSSLESFYVPYGTEKIGNFAFANCTSLKYISIPNTVNEISDSAFSSVDNLKIFCSKDSVAQEYAELWDIYYYFIGDTTGDGNVDIMDATYIQKYKIGAQGYDLTEYQRRCADVNRDGNVTVRDATLIQMKLAKYDVDF